MLYFSDKEKSDIVVETITLPSGDIVELCINESKNVPTFKYTGKNSARDFKKFIKDHPALRTVAVKAGIDALDAYKRNKSITARFFAKTPLERRLYSSLTKDLLKSGNYKMVQKKHIYGGVMYELERRKYPS